MDTIRKNADDAVDRSFNILVQDANGDGVNIEGETLRLGGTLLATQDFAGTLTHKEGGVHTVVFTKTESNLLAYSEKGFLFANFNLGGQGNIAALFPFLVHADPIGTAQPDLESAINDGVTAVETLSGIVELVKEKTDLLTLAAISQKVLRALHMLDGNRVELNAGTEEIIVYDTDGTTELGRKPFTRFDDPQNPLLSVGGS
jgi:hypothetical protein